MGCMQTHFICKIWHRGGLQLLEDISIHMQDFAFALVQEQQKCEAIKKVEKDCKKRKDALTSYDEHVAVSFYIFSAFV